MRLTASFLHRSLSLLVFPVLAILCALPAHAQDKVYVEVDGIAGESTDAAHTNWIDAFGLSHDANIPIAVGGGGQPLPGTPDLGDIFFLKGTDKSTPLLHNRLATGQQISFINIEVCRTVGGGPDECYYRLELQNPFIASISLSGSSCIDPASSCVPTQTESVGLFVTQIIYRYDPGGKAQSCSCWDAIANKSCGC